MSNEKKTGWIEWGVRAGFFLVGLVLGTTKITKTK